MLIFEHPRGKSASGNGQRGRRRRLFGRSRPSSRPIRDHVIAAVVLFQFGTGPVKGFAVTLSIGIVCSMFTAIFVTRIFFDYFLWFRKIKTVSI